MKFLRSIVLLALSLFALRGEAASGWTSAGAPSFGLVPANRRVTFNVNVTGLGDSPATLHLVMFASEGIWEYEWAVGHLSTPAASPAHDLVNGKVSFTEKFVLDELNEINNLYYEIFIDADHFMLARFGEDPKFSATLNHIEYDPEFPDDPLFYYYDVNQIVEFRNGYVAAYHDGADPTAAPEPTNGMLLLIGLAALSLRRRASRRRSPSGA